MESRPNPHLRGLRMLQNRRRILRLISVMVVDDIFVFRPALRNSGPARS